MLAQKASSSFSWNLAGSLVRFGASFVIGVILARVLGPEPFGLVSLAMIFISIGNLIIESGLNSGLVQKEEITNKDIQYVFTIQIVLAFLIMALISALAPLIAEFYHQPAVIPVLQVLSITLLLQSASQTSTALLKRKLAFSRIQQASIASYLIGYLCVGLPLAISGYAVWSLIFAQLAQSFSYLVIVYATARHPITLVFRDPGGVSRFGLNILGTNIANWIISNYDNTSIGWAYGPTSLGLYNRAWTLAMTPVQIIVSSAQTVLFSASSKLNGSTERVKNVFIGVFTIFGIVLFPFSIFEALVAKDLIQFIYGDKWLASVPFLAVLSLAMPFFALMAIEGPVLAGLGKPEIELKIQWLVLGFTLVVFLFAIRSSLIMIVWSVVLIYIFRFIALSLRAFKVLAIAPQDILNILISIISISTVFSVVVYFIGQFSSGLPIYLRLLLQTATGGSVWIIVFLLGVKRFLPAQVESLINRFIPKKFTPFFGKI